MRFRVYLLRYRGRRLSWRDVVNGPKYVGDLISELVTVGEERYELLTLRSEDPACLPQLRRCISRCYSGSLLWRCGFAVLNR
jgi:hypothetical protein